MKKILFCKKLKRNKFYVKGSKAEQVNEIMT